MINIAIDGFGGSGKGTLSKAIAERYKLKTLDTGAIYRGLACEYKKRGLPVPTAEIVKEFVKDIDIEIFFQNGVEHVVVNGTDHTTNLRVEEISLLAAKVSSFDVVRASVRDLQRSFAENNNCVVEGRDIGTEVLPKADVKFFLTASAKVRAERRYNQIKNKPNAPTFAEVLNDLNKRDYNDVHRKVAPLKPAKDAIIVDTTNMTLEQSLEVCAKHIDETLARKHIILDQEKQ